MVLGSAGRGLRPGASSCVCRVLLTSVAVGFASTALAQQAPAHPLATTPQSTPAPAYSRLELIDIEPDPKTPLRVGDNVKLKVTIRYVLESAEATLDLKVQTANKSVVTHRESAAPGTETRIWTVEFRAPEARSIDVVVTMSSPGHGVVGVENRTYRVSAN